MSTHVLCRRIWHKCLLLLLPPGCWVRAHVTRGRPRRQAPPRRKLATVAARDEMAQVVPKYMNFVCISQVSHESEPMLNLDTSSQYACKQILSSDHYSCQVDLNPPPCHEQHARRRFFSQESGAAAAAAAAARTVIYGWKRRNLANANQNCREANGGRP